MLRAVLAAAAAASAAAVFDPVVIADANFSASPAPWDARFTGIQPLPDLTGQGVAQRAAKASMQHVRGGQFVVGDPFLAATLPGWAPPAGAKVTRPWVTGLASVRLLGGLAVHNASDDTYAPIYDWDCVQRAADGSLVYNWTRVDATLDGFLEGEGLRDFLIVLDNVPYAFVAEANRYYVSYGLASPPDDPAEFAAFIGDFAAHLVARYGAAVVAAWRFRLGAEADGPRWGPPWANYTPPNPPFVAPNGRGGKYTSRTSGYEAYTETYIAVAAALRRVVPHAAFGPSNMCGLNSRTLSWLTELGRRARAAGAALGFAAASEYSQWSHDGLAPVAGMGNGASVMQAMLAAAGEPKAPLEVHEWGWAPWGKWDPAVFGTAATTPTGAWGAAWNLGSLLYQRQRGISRVLHWLDAFDSTVANRNASGTCLPGTTWCATTLSGCVPTCRHAGNPLVAALGWLLNALQHVAAGGATLSEFVEATPGGGVIGAVKGTVPGGASYLLLHFAPNASADATRRFRVHIAAEDAHGTDCAALTVRQQILNRTTSVEDAIEAELYAAGMKTPGTARNVERVDKIATAAGLKHLAARAADWTALNRKSLQFTAFEGTVLPAAAGGCDLLLDLPESSLGLLTLMR